MWLVVDLVDDLRERTDNEEMLGELLALRASALDMLFRWRRLEAKGCAPPKPLRDGVVRAERHGLPSSRSHDVDDVINPHTGDG